MNDLIKDEQGMIKTGTGTAVNPQFMSAQGLAQARSFANLPTTISGDTLANAPTPINLPTPTTPTPDTANAISAMSGANITQAKNEIARMEAEAKATAQTEAAQTKASLWERIQGKKEVLTEKATAMATPEMVALKEAKVKAATDLEVINQAEINELAALNTQNMTAAGSLAAQTGISRKYALQRANLSVISDIADRKYTSAENTINQVAQLKMEALQPEIDFFSAFLSSNEANLTNAEKAIIRTKKDELATAQSNIQNNVDYAMDLAKTAIANGQADIGAQIYMQAQNPDSKFFAQNIANLAGQIKVVPKATGVGGITTLTPQVLDGFTSMWDLSQSDREKVTSDLYAKGFGSDTPPVWYKDYLQSERGQTLKPDVVQSEWIKYRDSIMKAPSKRPEKADELPSWLKSLETAT